MEKEKLKLITALFLSLDNQIQSIDNANHKGLLKMKSNQLKKQFSNFTKVLFKGLDGEQVSIYDEYSNTIADIIDLSHNVGLDKSYLLLNACNNNELIEVDGDNPAVKNQLRYLNNFK